MCIYIYIYIHIWAHSAAWQRRRLEPRGCGLLLRRGHEEITEIINLCLSLFCLIISHNSYMCYYDVLHIYFRTDAEMDNLQHIADCWLQRWNSETPQFASFLAFRRRCICFVQMKVHTILQALKSRDRLLLLVSTCIITALLMYMLTYVGRGLYWWTTPWEFVSFHG